LLKYNPEDRVRTILKRASTPLEELPEVPPLAHKDNAIAFLHQLVFLGQPQVAGEITNSGRLSDNHVQALGAIGITERTGRYFHRGMVTASTKVGAVDLVTVHRYINLRLAEATACPEGELARDISALTHGIELCMRGEIAAAYSPSVLLDIIRKEHDLQLSQLGTLVLPQSFISTLTEPVYFVDTTAKRLGRLVQLLHS